MVNSILNPEINYPEIKKLDSDDTDYDASLYETTVLGIDIIIALGQAKYTFIDKNVIYFPIYLVKNDRVANQLGIYEIMENQLPNIVDEDGDIDLDNIDTPLIYKFVTIEMLKDAENKPVASGKKLDDDEEVEEVEEVEEDDDTDIILIDAPLPEQSEKQSGKESEEYIDNKTNPWIQKYMKSNEYTIRDNEGGGDCLFAVIRDAFKSIDKDISITELRKKVSDEATEEIYQNYKLHYDTIIESIQENDTRSKQLSKLNNELRDRLKQSKVRDEQQVIVIQAKEVGEEFKRIKSETKVQKQLLQDFKIMKRVNSLEDFKKAIKTCDFWADTWAISTLERILQIKLVILSSESWSQGDVANVLQCGQLNDPILEEEGIFEPQYYIIADYTGSHYKLINYKNHSIFNFKELPYSIKIKVTNKCLEGITGTYKIIPQFKLFNKELGIDEPIELDVEIVKEEENALYDNNIVFQYYNKSNNKPLPGKGNGEKIDVLNIKDFSKLAEIPEWRRKLDNKYESVFELDGHKWNSIEHYYQANKFKNTNKEFYLLFSLDSGSKISKDVDLAKAAGSKNGKLKTELLRSKDIKIDPDFYGGADEKVLENGLYAKFTQDDGLKDLLVKTQNAKLLHYNKGAESGISNALMMVRNRIKAE